MTEQIHKKMWCFCSNNTCICSGRRKNNTYCFLFFCLTSKKPWNHLTTWSAICLQENTLKHPADQPSDKTSLQSLHSLFSNYTHGIRSVDKEGPVSQKSSISFNERTREAWDPWVVASKSEPAVLPLWLHLTTNKKKKKRKPEMSTVWSLGFLLCSFFLLLHLILSELNRKDLVYAD